MLFQIVEASIGRQRRAIQVALKRVAPERFERALLRAGFYVFGDDLDSKRCPELDHRTDDVSAIAVLQHLAR